MNRNNDATVEVLASIKRGLYKAILGSFRIDYDGQKEELLERLSAINFNNYKLKQYRNDLLEIIEELILIDDLNIEYSLLANYKKDLLSLSL